MSAMSNQPIFVKIILLLFSDMIFRDILGVFFNGVFLFFPAIICLWKDDGLIALTYRMCLVVDAKRTTTVFSYYNHIL